MITTCQLTNVMTCTKHDRRMDYQRIANHNNKDNKRDAYIIELIYYSQLLFIFCSQSTLIISDDITTEFELHYL